MLPNRMYRRIACKVFLLARPPALVPKVHLKLPKYPNPTSVDIKIGSIGNTFLASLIVINRVESADSSLSDIPHASALDTRAAPAASHSSNRSGTNRLHLPAAQIATASAPLRQTSQPEIATFFHMCRWRMAGKPKRALGMRAKSFERAGKGSERIPLPATRIPLCPLAHSRICIPPRPAPPRRGGELTPSANCSHGCFVRGKAETGLARVGERRGKARKDVQQRSYDGARPRNGRAPCCRHWPVVGLGCLWGLARHIWQRECGSVEKRQM
jgi:hypothetical protein